MLQPPNGEPAGCPKCAYSRVSVTYHPAIMPEGTKPKPSRGEAWPCSRFMGRVYGFGVEHLCRVCERCGYGWCEKTADSAPAEPPVRQLR